MHWRSQILVFLLLFGFEWILLLSRQRLHQIQQLMSIFQGQQRIKELESVCFTPERRAAPKGSLPALRGTWSRGRKRFNISIKGKYNKLWTSRVICKPQTAISHPAIAGPVNLAKLKLIATIETTEETDPWLTSLGANDNLTGLCAEVAIPDNNESTERNNSLRPPKIKKR